jgi:hypothetical protein
MTSQDRPMNPLPKADKPVREAEFPITPYAQARPFTQRVLFNANTRLLDLAYPRWANGNDRIDGMLYAGKSQGQFTLEDGAPTEVGRTHMLAVCRANYAPLATYTLNTSECDEYARVHVDIVGHLPSLTQSEEIEHVGLALDALTHALAEENKLVFVQADRGASQFWLQGHMREQSALYTKFSDRPTVFVYDESMEGTNRPYWYF